MSKAVYNGIELGYLRTTTYRNEPEASVDRPDMLYRKTTLQFSSVLAANVVPAVGAETVQDVLIRIRHMLELPRRPFYYEVGGQRVIDLPGGKDDANGPFPIGVNVELVADASFLITWGVEIRLADCGSNSKQILSHRWTETASINDEHLTTYTRSGRLVVASRAGLSPDSFRGTITPKIGPKFVRQRAEYSLHENGLELAFTFVDQEQYVMPPFPAIKMAGWMAITSTDHTGVKRIGRLEIELTGPPDVPKKILLQKCIEIGMSRADRAGLIRASNGRAIIGGGVHEDLVRNKIKLTLQWLMKPPGTQLTSGSPSFTGSLVSSFTFGIGSNIQGSTNQAAPNTQPSLNAKNQPTSSLAMNSDWVGLPLPGSNNGMGIAPPTRGDLDWLQLVAASFSDPCLTSTVNPPPSENTGIQTNLVFANVRKVPELPLERLGGAYDDVQDAFYDYYECVCHYIHDEGMEVAPAMKTRTAGKAFRLSGESMRLEVEYSAKRAGRTPVIPDPRSPSQDSNWVYTGGTNSPEIVGVAADGVTLIHAISGLLRFKAVDPCKANIIAPVPPYLSQSIDAESRLAAAFVSSRIVFLSGAQSGQVLNPFCGFSTQLVSGGQTGVPGGGFPFS